MVLFFHLYVDPRYQTHNVRLEWQVLLVPSSQSLPLFKALFYIYLFICLCIWVCTCVCMHVQAPCICHGIHVKAVLSLIPPGGSWGLKSHHLAWQQSSFIHQAITLPHIPFYIDFFVCTCLDAHVTWCTYNGQKTT